MKYLKIFTDFLDVTTELGDGAMGRLFRAMLRYARDGAVPEMKGKAAVAWAVARQHMDREAEAYEAKVSGMERARSAKKQIETKQKSMPESLISREDKDKEKDKDKDKDKDISFLPAAAGVEKKETHPSLEEIMKYAQETYLSVDAEHFYHYYEANGWRMGQNDMKDWKAALKAWARNAPVAPRPAQVKQALSDRELFQQAIELHRMQKAAPVGAAFCINKIRRP